MDEEDRERRFHDLQLKSVDELRRIRMDLQQKKAVLSGSPEEPAVQEELELVEEELARRESS